MTILTRRAQPLLARGLGLFILVQAGSFPAWAQAPIKPGIQLDSLQPGCCTIRVRQTGLSARGIFQGTPTAGIVLLQPCTGALCPISGPDRRRILLDQSTRIDLERGNQAGLGTIIGAAAGLGLLTAIALHAPDEDVDGDSIARGVVVLGLPGALLGALVGSAFPRWIPVRPPGLELSER